MPQSTPPANLDNKLAITPSNPPLPTSISTPSSDITHPHPQTQSPLLSLLPLELRLQIYTYIFLSAHPSSSLPQSPRRPAPTTYSPSSPLLLHHPPFPTASTLQVLQTCRRVYAEARALPFQLVTFAFQRWYGSSVWNAARWCEQRRLQSGGGWQVRQLRRLRVDVVGQEVLEGRRWERGWAKLLRVLEGASGSAPLGMMDGGCGEREAGVVVVQAVVRADDAVGWERVRRILEKGIWGGEAWRELDEEGDADGDGEEAEGERGRKGRGARRVRVEVVKSEVRDGGGEGVKDWMGWYEGMGGNVF